MFDDWGICFKLIGTAKVSYAQEKSEYGVDEVSLFTTDILKSLGSYCATDGAVPLVRMAENTLLVSGPESPNNDQKMCGYYLLPS